MNLLAHLYLADLTATSAAGQLMGDMVKGSLNERFEPQIERGIRLHRAIDGFTDSHPLTATLRRRFLPPLRRYGGILVDIGFDYCLARMWARYSDTALPQFAEHIVEQARREWPVEAPEKAPPSALVQVLVDYQKPKGLQRALDSVDRRLTRISPLPNALPALLNEYDAFAHSFDAFFPELCDYAQRYQ